MNLDNAGVLQPPGLLSRGGAGASRPTEVGVDVRGLAALRRDAKADPGGGIEAAARQFEGLLIGLMLKEMRAAPLEEDPFGGIGVDMARDLADQQLARHLAEHGGVGFADALIAQMQRRIPAAEAAERARNLAQASGLAGAAGVPPEQSRTTTTVPPPMESVSELPVAAASAAGTPATGDGSDRVDAALLPVAGDLAVAALTKGRVLPASRTLETSQGATSGPRLPRPSGLGGEASSHPVETSTSHPVQGMDSPEAFVQSLLPYAQRTASALGVDPRVILAQAALETGWGRHLPAQADGRPAFNFFGIKAAGSPSAPGQPGWQGEVTRQGTLEFEGGRLQRRVEPFRAYSSPADSFADYRDLIGSSPRYAAVRAAGQDAERYARELQRAGYATDPQYASKLISLLRSEPLASLAPVAVAGSETHAAHLPSG